MNEKYESIFDSFRTVFDSMIGGYSYEGSGSQEMIYSVLVILNLFLVAILLLNFMVAILS